MIKMVLILTIRDSPKEIYNLSGNFMLRTELLDELKKLMKDRELKEIRLEFVKR